MGHSSCPTGGEGCCPALPPPWVLPWPRSLLLLMGCKEAPHPSQVQEPLVLGRDQCPLLLLLLLLLWWRASLLGCQLPSAFPPASPPAPKPHPAQHSLPCPPQGGVAAVLAGVSS